MLYGQCMDCLSPLTKAVCRLWDSCPVNCNVSHLLRPLNITDCSSHRTCTSSFLLMETMVRGRRGAEENSHVLRNSESRYIWDMHFIKDQERYPRLSSLDIVLESSGWQPEWQHTPIVTSKVQHFIKVRTALCYTQNQLCPFYLESYHLCCEIALGRSVIAIFLQFLLQGILCPGAWGQTLNTLQTQGKKYLISVFPANMDAFIFIFFFRQ